MKTFLVFALIVAAVLRVVTLPNEAPEQIIATGVQAGGILLTAVVVLAWPARRRRNRKVMQRTKFATSISRLIDGMARDVR